MRRIIFSFISAQKMCNPDDDMSVCMWIKWNKVMNMLDGLRGYHS